MHPDDVSRNVHLPATVAPCRRRKARSGADPGAAPSRRKRFGARNARFRPPRLSTPRRHRSRCSILRTRLFHPCPL